MPQGVDVVVVGLDGLLQLRGLLLEPVAELLEVLLGRGGEVALVERLWTRCSFFCLAFSTVVSWASFCFAW